MSVASSSPNILSNPALAKGLEGLKDIKPPMVIEEYSLYVFLGIIGALIALVIVAVLAFKLWRKRLFNHPLRMAMKYFCALAQNNDAKAFAYEVTGSVQRLLHYLQQCQADKMKFVAFDKRLKPIKGSTCDGLIDDFEALLEALEICKYKPRVVDADFEVMMANLKTLQDKCHVYL